MRWLLRLYPAPWRERYGEEFGAVPARQRTSLGLVFDALGGAVDAHLHSQIQRPKSKTIPGDDTMTLAMFERCAAGPKLSPSDRRIASRSAILSALLMAVLYLALTKIYRGALPVEALGYASAPFLGLIYEQTAYLRKSPWLPQALVLGAGLSAMYLFMLAVCVLGSKL
jgi:hypothetical protein